MSKCKVKLNITNYRNEKSPKLEVGPNPKTNPKTQLFSTAPIIEQIPLNHAAQVRKLTAEKVNGRGNLQGESLES